MASQIYLNSVGGLRTVHQINILSVDLLLFVLRWSCHMHLSFSMILFFTHNFLVFELCVKGF